MPKALSGYGQGARCLLHFMGLVPRCLGVLHQRNLHVFSYLVKLLLGFLEFPDVTGTQRRGDGGNHRYRAATTLLGQQSRERRSQVHCHHSDLASSVTGMLTTPPSVTVSSWTDSSLILDSLQRNLARKDTGLSMLPSNLEGNPPRTASRKPGKTTSSPTDSPRLPLE